MNPKDNRFLNQCHYKSVCGDNPGSRFLFAYSGHGFTDLEKNGYLTTHDNYALTKGQIRMIKMEWLREQLNYSLIPAHQSLVLINSGPGNAFDQKAFTSPLLLVNPEAGSHSITAGSSNEVNRVYPRVGEGSLFFEKISSALNGEADLFPQSAIDDEQGDGIITVGELTEYLIREFHKINSLIRPVKLSDLSRGKSKGGFFFISRSGLKNRTSKTSGENLKKSVITSIKTTRLWRQNQLDQWEIINSSGNLADLKKFINTYKEGTLVDYAIKRHNRLKELYPKCRNPTSSQRETLKNLARQVNQVYSPQNCYGLYRKLNMLEEITLSSKISDLDLISGLDRLRSLSIEGGQILNVPAFKNLTHLRVDKSPELDLRMFERLRNLTHLKVTGTKVKNVRYLNKFTNLVFLHLEDNELKSSIPFQDLTTLRELHIIKNQLKEIKGLETLVDLTHLNLDKNRLDDLASIQNLKKLTTLSLGSNVISDISPLQNLIQLKSLNLSDNKVADVRALKNFAILSDLSLGSNQVTDLSSLINLKWLQTLDITSLSLRPCSPKTADDIITGYACLPPKEIGF